MIAVEVPDPLHAPVAGGLPDHGGVDDRGAVHLEFHHPAVGVRRFWGFSRIPCMRTRCTESDRANCVWIFYIARFLNRPPITRTFYKCKACWHWPDVRGAHRSQGGSGAVRRSPEGEGGKRRNPRSGFAESSAGGLRAARTAQSADPGDANPPYALLRPEHRQPTKDADSVAGGP
jgi:hypothetical protein